MTRRSLSQRVAWLATMVTGGIALLALAGWTLRIATLTSMARRSQTMSVITAICLLLVALQLACLQMLPSATCRRVLPRAPGVIVALVGLLTVALYSTDLLTGAAPPVEDIPVLRLFWIPATRLALLTAVLFVLVGGALWLLASGSRRAANAAHALAAPVAMAGYLVVLSYLLRVSAMHEFLGVRVALNTGLAFCAVSLAILALRPDTWLTSVFTGDQAGSVMARVLLPVLLLLPGAIGWLRLYGERAGAFQSEVGVVLVALTYAVVLVSLVGLTARSVNRADARLRLAEEQAHAALRASEQQLATVFRTSPTGIFITRLADGRYVDVNDAYLRIIGYSAQEVIGRTSLELSLWANPEDRSLLLQALQEAGEFEAREVRLRQRSGQLVDVLVSVLPLDRGGETCALGTVADISKRKLAEQALRRSKEEYQALFAGMNDGFAVHEIICDGAGQAADYRFLDVNPAFERLTGLRRQDLIGRTVLEVMPGTERVWIERYGRVALTGEPARFEQYASELGRHYEAYAYQPVQGQFAVVFRDVTERKQTEAALRRYDWLLNEDGALEAAHDQGATPQAYGDLAELNTDGLLRRTLGRELLADMVGDYVLMLGSSSAIYEKNGDYAHGIFASGWCRFLDQASREACGTADNRAALASGKWLCHESCWTRASKQAVEAGRIVDVECDGGLRLFAVPIQSAGEIVGSINFGYGEPPRDAATIQAIAGRYQVDPGRLRDLAAEYEPRPSFIVQSAKSRLVTSARLIGEMVERRQAEEALRRAKDELDQRVRERTAELCRVNQTLRMVSECNEAVVRASGEAELVQEICRIVHDLGGYRMVWVGYAEEDPAKTVRPVAAIGFEEGYLEQARITWTDEPRGRGPTGSCIRLKEIRVCHDFLTDQSLEPWREQALARGYQSSIALPLLAGARAFGALTIYSERPDAFDAEQAALLAELAADLAFGIEALRSRAERDHALQLAETRAGQLRALATELVQAEQRERRRLAQVLHDHLQQLLVGARLNLASIEGALTTKRLRDSVGRVSAILDKATETAHTLTGELSPPALHEQGLVAGLQWLAREMRRKHGLQVHVEGDAQAQPVTAEVGVFLFEAVRELLFNVVKHARVDRAEVSVARPNGGRVLVTVADSGAGFEPRLTDLAGSQLSRFGLFSIRERLRYLGGRMDVESAPGRGSRFTLEAPSGAVQPAAGLPAPATQVAEVVATPLVASDRAAGGEVGRKTRVLLADDHPVMRQSLALVLQGQADIEVVGETGDGEEAVSLARRLRPDVVLMDVSMPRVNGIDATRQIVSELPAVRVIGLSMHAEAEASAAMRQAGAEAYLPKGGPVKDVIAAIRSRDSAQSPEAAPAAAARRRQCRTPVASTPPRRRTRGPQPLRPPQRKP